MADGPFPRDPSWSASRTLFEHVALFADVQSALGTGRGGAILRDALDEAIAAFLRAVMPATFSAGVPRELVILDMVARVSTFLRWWLEHQPNMTAAQAHDMLCELLSSELPKEVHNFLTASGDIGRSTLA